MLTRFLRRLVIRLCICDKTLGQTCGKAFEKRPQERFVDSRDVANDCPDATKVETNTLDLIIDQGSDIGRKDMLKICLKVCLKLGMKMAPDEIVSN